MVPGIEQGAKTARPEGSGCPARSVTQIKERKSRRPTCSAGVPNTLTHRNPDLADGWGESQFWTVRGECSLVYLSVTACHHVTCQEVTASLCDSIPAPLSPPWQSCVLHHAVTTLLPLCLDATISQHHQVTQSLHLSRHITLSPCHMSPLPLRGFTGPANCC